jgi:Family of unknown function (DUF6230)
MSVDSNRAQGKVKWRRFAIVAVPAVAIAGILVGLTAEGALASSISVSGQEFTITSDQLTGTGFAQFGGSLPNSSNGQTPVIVSTMKNATLSHLCQSVTVLGLTIRLTAGAGGSPASATNLVVDADSQTASSAVFNNLSIGQDAGTLGGPAGTFGEEADSVTINNLVQHTWYTTAGTFTLPGLSLGFGGSC